ncbi:MAG: pyridoxal phosphate-dependent aminotransferase [Desulfobacteraceae bacterium]|nr:pyridoxal phosphate-dependent aminotransferase [Desulfobacteraceae bacterium]
MTISRKVAEVLTRSSWIRKMFEEGARLKAHHGADRVFDFSLGNPNLSPPAAFRQVARAIIDQAGDHDHVYMPNAGYPFVRQRVAETVARQEKLSVTAEEIIMTCGAAGALNVIFKALLDPGDEVITPAPYFVEYTFYADNHGGVLKTVPTRADFTLDLDGLAAAITPRTRAVLINSPNNPTGQVYSAESLQALGALLETRGRELGRSLYLISDEPYRRIVFDGVTVPGIFDCCANSLIANSYSKDLSLAGERIGYVAVSPRAEFRADLVAGMTLANRILGFVNAPALMQRVVAELQDVSVDVAAYQRKRDLLCDGLAACGYDFVTPKGALYAFPRTPLADDVKFVQALQEELILTVPGSGFGRPGHFRIAFCVSDETIVNALPGFRRVMARFR